MSGACQPRRLTATTLGVTGDNWILVCSAALRELRRVLKSNGRLVIGEVVFDPEFVFLGSLKDLAEQASFAFEQRLGGSLSYLARFRPM